MDEMLDRFAAMVPHSAYDYLAFLVVYVALTAITVLVRVLIQSEISAHPEAVGPPVSIVEVSRDGVHWISAGTCAGHD